MKNFYYLVLFAWVIPGIPVTNAQNVWTQKADFAGGPRTSCAAFVLGNGAYVGTGYDSTDFKRSFWMYNPATNSWTQITSLGGATGAGLGRDAAVGFGIGTKGYIGTGQGPNPYLNDFWEYNAAFDVWTQKASFAGTPRRKCVGFSLNGKGYIGLGQDANGFKNDMWEYDPANNTWVQKANFPGTPRQLAVSFESGGLMYVGLGDDGVNKSDFFAFDPGANSWVPRASFGGSPRKGAIAFSLNGKGYVGTGYDNSLSNVADFWEYNPFANSWATVSPFGGGARSSAVAVSMGGMGYAGTGYENGTRKDWWEFSPPLGLFDKTSLSGGIQIFPNPVVNDARIEIRGDGFVGGDIEFSVYDLQGKLVQRFPGNSESRFERAGLKAGGYFLTAVSEGRIIGSVKIVLI
jgi:N-acetylneuraminic acid mutarotase